MKMPSRFNFITYIKLALIIILITIEIVVCAQAYPLSAGIGAYIALVVCCIAFAAVETINQFAAKGFALKMVFFGIDSAFLLTICILAGNSLLSTLYCIVLTGCYMTVDRFRDRTILFGVSCFIFSGSFIVGWVITHVGAPLYNSIVEIFSGVLFGLLAMVIDYIVVQFLLKFYHTNLELSAALKEAGESRARLEDAYELLTQTKVFEERNRIAKDIHDNAGHSMTTVIMQTEAAKLLIDENPEEAKKRIISANIQARNALEQMRESVHLLAGRTQNHTLSEELQEIIAQTIDGTDIKARYDMDNVACTAEQRRFVCNSVKELLANGIRHGNATAFYLELKETESEIKLLVSDNGTGVCGEVKEGFGLKGIRERAEKMGGKCAYGGEEDEGFETEIILPKEEKND